MNLVLIETGGNQSFIFASNKMRECVGASELIARVGTRFVLEAVQDIGGPELWSNSSDERRNSLRDKLCNSDVDGSNPVEVILAVSGKTLLLTRDEIIGRRIVSSVTQRALKEAPGLDVRGVVSGTLDLEQQSIHHAIKSVHNQFEIAKSRITDPSSRFLRLPIIAECTTSGLPASRWTNDSDRLPQDESGPRSALSLKKLAARAGWQDRLKDLLAVYQVTARLPYSTMEIEKLDCDWLAIIHADGNGIGQVFLNLEKYVHSEAKELSAWNRDYINQLRGFSLALDECTEKAFCRSLQVLRLRNGVTPIVPLVLGGDDLTVVCDGKQALLFTKKFIDCFEEETARNPEVKRILHNGLTTCAGVAIVKPHFPFFVGYQLAEELLKSAKKLKPQSAIDFHMHYGSGGSNHERILRELTVDRGETRLMARPYLVGHVDAPQGRTWEDLAHRVEAVRARDDEHRRRLPNTMLHDLREGLFLGREAAEARMRLIRERYRPYIDPILVDDNLFWLDGQQHVTGLLDAIDAAEFWEGQP